MMKRAHYLLLLLAACGGGCGGAEMSTEETRAPETTATGSTADTPEQGPVAEPPTIVDGCTPHAEPADAPAMHADLIAVAPQYFHGSHRGGFDAYRGGAPLFPWFDVHDLDHGVTPPRGVRAAASTASALLVVRDGQLGVLERDGGEVTWTGQDMYPEEAVEGGGDLRVLGRTGTTWRVFHRNAAQVTDTGVAQRTWDIRIAVTADGTPVLAWLSRDGGRMRIHLAWDLDVESATVVDEVTLPEPVAALSERSRVELAIAADGQRGVGLAWRPLADASFTDVGSQTRPPSTAAGAEIRWFSVQPDGTRSEVGTHPTLAHPLGGVSGIGPWGLNGNGMRARTLAGRALFVWQHEQSILGVRVDGSSPVELAPDASWPLIAFSRSEEPRLLLFDSSPRVRAYALSCR